MKSLSVWCIYVLTYFSLSGQCNYDNTYFTNATPSSCPGSFTVPCMYAGTYATVTLQPGNLYTFTTCGNAAFDSQITVYNSTGTAVYGYNDDACNLQSTVTYLANTAEVVHVLLDRYDCSNSSSSCMPLQISCDAPMTLDSSNLPIVVINTAGGVSIPDNMKVDATMGIIYNGVGVRNYFTDPFNEYEGNIGIELRGSSSQMFPKKQYGFETRDNFGEGNDVSLFNMAFDNDWILYAPYSDKSLMRNVLAYEMGWDMGFYAPRTQFCEVVLNGEYQGVYVLTEKIKRKDGKVGTNDLESTDVSGNELTGDYVLKIDKTTGGGTVAWSSPIPPFPGASQSIGFQFHDPSVDSLNSMQINYIRNFITDFELALNGVNFSDPLLGYQPYIDIQSFVHFFLVNEVSRNVDGYRISSYINKVRTSEGGKLNAGPLWDFNLAFGNANYCSGGNTSGWELDFYQACSGDGWQNPFWWKKLLQDQTYAHSVNCTWQALRQGKWHTDSLMQRIDDWAAYLDESQARNFERWPVLGVYVWPNNFQGATYGQEVGYLKTWLTARLGWMDANMFGSCPDLGMESLEPLELSVYPNPAKNYIHISFPATVHNGEFYLLDLNGKTVARSSDIKGLGCDIPLGKLESGLYQIRVLDANSVYNGKILIQQ